ncbi:hypothetical protein [Streptomyces sp. CB01881]|uniref:hypothetical protein n=1 Tax=Streptomyces sp. CB01881 TaxID=2078691 RepID=UPI000CDC844C|nr:hypothetical protein [Streptomyces sp. CB01881]AUY48812.1 hypothetical protein C2142_07495 [Streptomyces sp. CB01881]TYC77301.1 hypothetical protein EH183_07500 [Streptomyces sp. CB01881]
MPHNDTEPATTTETAPGTEAGTSTGTGSDNDTGTNSGTSTATASGAETAAERLRARWAEPAAAVPPWYRRVSRRTWKVSGSVVAALAAFGVLATVFGPDDPVRYRLDAPQSIGELTRESDSSGAYAAQDAEIFPNTLGYIRFHEHFVAGYRRPGSTGTDFLVIGATGTFASPVRELDDLLGGVDPVLGPARIGATSPQASPSGYTVFPSGPLGGFLKCTVQDNGHKDAIAVCAWADATTVGSVTDYSQDAGSLDLTALAERTRAIRAAMTSRVDG